VTSHLAVMAIFAVLTSMVFAVIARETVREQLRAGLRLFAAFMAAAVAMGWLMYFIPL